MTAVDDGFNEVLLHIQRVYGNTEEEKLPVRRSEVSDVFDLSASANSKEPLASIIVAIRS
jgi:hypothetical protein